MKLSSLSQVQLEGCLDTVSKNPNDLTLLLNVQTCFHQSDLLDRAIEFNQTSSGNSWFVITGVIVSIFIQLFISIHSFITFIFKDKHNSMVSKEVNYLKESFAFINNKFNQLLEDLKNLIITENSDMKNLQGRLNKNGDIRREIDNLFCKVNDLVDESNQMKNFIYSNLNEKSTTIAILPPKELPKPSPKPKEPSFDISTAQGRAKWKEYINKSMQSKSMQDKPGQKPMQKPMQKPIQKPIQKPLQNNKILTSIDAKNHENENHPLRYCDVAKYGDNKKFKRVFIPARGWVSMKQFELEESIHGSSSMVSPC
ncbi:hypothetical protein HYPBUDRAFT_107183 [Hyphopichia burtonii NRRL Y-1933]|uniref:Uncharacterized protein n=1 Tax=Hyphopichia burtonii NRRL Y-1933 TaxID=984485 RepID=A0A1E4RKK6_9ASCO|nr:hypothetical protein HYPBUDRAFT_107183 [Hyphopichia burtonii NRRL Y-1933]ODV67783.1 hypothetical protein HYPBUDRAFT_107183 [Hyphopichia burtonii NRRL Y-1933]